MIGSLMDDIAEIERCEHRLADAMLHSDVAELDRLLGDAAFFVDQNGQRIGKEDDLAVHRSGMLKLFDLAQVGASVVRRVGDSAIVSVTTDVTGSYGDQKFQGRFAYLRLWHRTGSSWQIQAAQCTAVAVG